MEDEPLSGKPCTSKMEENVTNMRTLLKSDQCLTVRMISSALNLNHQTVYDILTEVMGMRTLGCCMTTTFPVNTAISVKEVLTKKVIPVVPKPTYEGCSKSIGPLVGKNTITYLDV
jgi:predicted regulator of amino acid metabolism with ACT domain